MQFIYRIAADCVVTLHMVYVLIVVLGLPITIFGILRKRPWARNIWWRSIHLAMILIVVMEACAGMTCPLTTWEQSLRDLAQQQSYHGAFVGNLIHQWLFYELPQWVFTLVYTAFGVLVLITFIVAPPRWNSAKTTNPSSGVAQ